MLGSTIAQRFWARLDLGQFNRCECVVRRAALALIVTLKFGAACYEICRLFP